MVWDKAFPAHSDHDGLIDNEQLHTRELSQKNIDDIVHLYDRILYIHKSW